MRKLLGVLSYLCFIAVFGIFLYEQVKDGFEYLAIPLDYGAVEIFIVYLLNLIKTPILIVVCLVGIKFLAQKNNKGYGYLVSFVTLYGLFWFLQKLLEIIYDGRMAGRWSFESWEQYLFLFVTLIMTFCGAIAYMSRENNKKQSNLAAFAAFFVLLASNVLLFLLSHNSAFSTLRLIIGTVGTIFGMGVFALPILGKE
ncbi:MAG: hypothetical protein K6C32_03905 [Bacilli bacterium]|nr:hypothetical protein [Bacilli bacterium]